ncbi:MAG: O-antigen ligase family protein [Candidatus Omnitrophica bacterium]|nr:O-antigen ligase family protein [Candidatus Omnitrophota bacterium]
MKDKLINILDFAIYWSIVVIPFSVMFGPGLANAYIGIACACFFVKKLIKKERIAVNTSVNWAYFLFIGCSILSIKNSLYMDDSVRGILRVFEYFLIFFVCSEEIKSKKQIKLIAASAALGVSLVSIDAIWQLVIGKDFIWGNTPQICPIGLPRPSASFPDPNVLGVYLSALVPLVAALAMVRETGKARIWMGIAVLLGLAGTVLTFARGTGIAVYAALLFIAIVKKQKAVIAVLVGALLVFPLVMPKSIKDWAKEIKYNPIVFLCNYDRISIYKNAVNMIKHHPVIGVGVNTFCKSYTKYKLPEPENAKTAETMYAHNIYLQMAGEIGFLGLGAFLLFLFFVFKNVFSVYRRLKDGYLSVIALSLMACIGAFLINGLTETNLYYPRVVMIFWYLIGFSLALKNIE